MKLPFKRHKQEQRLPGDLDEYFDDVLSHSHLSYLRGQEREAQKEEMMSELKELMVSGWIESLSPVDRTALNHMAAAGYSDETLLDFVEQNAPNKDEVSRQALHTFRARYTK